MSSKFFRKAKSIAHYYLFEKHPFAKLVCLVISIILFAYVHSEWQVQSIDVVEYDVPIQIKNIPNDLYIVSMDDKYASIVFGGKKNIFDSVIHDIVIYVDAEDAKEGINQYSLSIGNASAMPSNIQFTLTPKYINITFEKIGSVE